MLCLKIRSESMTDSKCWQVDLNRQRHTGAVASFEKDRHVERQKENGERVTFAAKRTQLRQKWLENTRELTGGGEGGGGRQRERGGGGGGRERGGEGETDRESRGWEERDRQTDSKRDRQGERRQNPFQFESADIPAHATLACSSPCWSHVRLLSPSSLSVPRQSSPPTPFRVFFVFFFTFFLTTITGWRKTIENQRAPTRTHPHTSEEYQACSKLCSVGERGGGGGEGLGGVRTGTPLNLFLGPFSLWRALAFLWQDDAGWPLAGLFHRLNCTRTELSLSLAHTHTHTHTYYTHTLEHLRAHTYTLSHTRKQANAHAHTPTGTFTSAPLSGQCGPQTMNFHQSNVQ